MLLFRTQFVKSRWCWNVSRTLIPRRTLFNTGYEIDQLGNRPTPIKQLVPASFFAKLNGIAQSSSFSSFKNYSDSVNYGSFEQWDNETLLLELQTFISRRRAFDGANDEFCKDLVDLEICIRRFAGHSNGSVAQYLSVLCNSQSAFREFVGMNGLHPKLVQLCLIGNDEDLQNFHKFKKFLQVYDPLSKPELFPFRIQRADAKTIRILRYLFTTNFWYFKLISVDNLENGSFDDRIRFSDLMVSLTKEEILKFYVQHIETFIEYKFPVESTGLAQRGTINYLKMIKKEYGIKTYSKLGPTVVEKLLADKHIDGDLIETGANYRAVVSILLRDIAHSLADGGLLDMFVRDYVATRNQYLKLRTENVEKKKRIQQSKLSREFME